jgi:UvrB/uvrC motif
MPYSICKNENCHFESATRLTSLPRLGQSPAHMNCDISHLLDRWDYRPGDVMVRKIDGKDGRTKLQLRVDLGILQMNTEGRPDGKRPNGHDSFFDFLLSRLDAHMTDQGNDTQFKLSGDQCVRLHLEALQFHHRYICMLQLEEHEAVERDCIRNLSVFDFVSRYAAAPAMAWSLQQFRPQLLMILTRARATPLLRTAKATSEIESGIQMIGDFYQETDRPDLKDQSLEIESLQNWLSDIKSQRVPRKKMTRRELLELQLSEAVQKEDYERAARVRDQIRSIKPRAKQH